MVLAPMDALRLVIWNCRTGYLDKHPALVGLQPDLAIVPEASLASIQSLEPRPSSTAFIGPNPRKGLAVLAFGPYSVEPLPKPATDLPDALALEVRGPRPFTLLAVWTRGPKYIRNLHAVLDAWAPRLKGDVVVAGDFNSNNIWDRLHGSRCHSAMVRRLEADHGLVSAYHAVRGEQHGHETTPTFHMYLKDRPAYHIDYCFIPKRWLPAVRSVEVVSEAPWRRLSDHVPLVVTLGSTTKPSSGRSRPPRARHEGIEAPMKVHPLKNALQVAGMTQTELARTAAVSQTMVSHVLSGQRERFAPDTALRIVSALKARGVELALTSLIFPWDANMRPDTRAPVAETSRFQPFWSTLIRGLARALPEELVRPPARGPNQRFPLLSDVAWLSAYLAPARNQAGVFLAICSGPEGAALFEKLAAERSDIEEALGLPVAWTADRGTRMVIATRTFDGDVLGAQAPGARRLLSRWVPRFVKVFLPRMDAA